MQPMQMIFHKEDQQQDTYSPSTQGDVVVCRSKTQSLTALSSIEAESIAAVTAAKTAKYIKSVIYKLASLRCMPAKYNMYQMACMFLVFL